MTHTSQSHPNLLRTARRASALVACLLPVLIVAGCSASGDIDNTPAPVILVVGNISQTTSPFGDVLTSGGTIPEDGIEVQFTARLKNGTDNTAPTLQEIIVQRYEVTFARTDGGTAIPAGFQRGMNVRVRVTPHNSQSDILTNAQLVLVPSTIKSQPPISHLISPGFEPETGFVNIQVNATIRFFGHTLAGDAVSATATIGVNFANFGDSNS